MAHRHHVDPDELLPLADYRRLVLAAFSPLPPVEVALDEAHGTVLAADVRAPRDIPPFPNSAMDGYALRAGTAASGDRLAVVGEIAAGSPERPSPEAGEAVRIMTGAPLPEGVDAVIPVELVREEGEEVVLGATPEAGDNVRSAGESVRQGELVLSGGRLLGAQEIGMLAAMGIGRMSVHPRPRVAVLATGDELVEPGEPLQPGQIHESNGRLVAAQVIEAGATADRRPVAVDDREGLRRAFEDALAEADLLVTTGGVSAGRYDLSKQVLAEMGDVTFRKVGMQPGMPQAFGAVAGKPVFGLPGNPVSCAVSFEVHVRPAIRIMQGRTDLDRRSVVATLAEDVSSPPHKVSFLRVTLQRDGAGWAAATTGAQGSGILHSMVLADGLAEVPADRTSMAAGETVTVHLLREPA